MFDQIYYVGLPSMLLLTSNIKIDFLLSVPMILIGTYVTMSWSFQESNDNMACFLDPTGFRSNAFSRTFIYLLISMLVVWEQRRT